MTNKKYNPKNELIKSGFLEILENAKGRDPKTVTDYANAIHEFEISTGFCDFKKFEVKQAINFKEVLSNKKNKRTGENISKSYLHHYVSHVKDFFEWLSKQRDYEKFISYDDAQYFTLSRNDRNRARATNFQESHTVEEIISTIRKMPNSNEIEMRNKAMVSICFLTTPRISALQTARVGSIRYFREDDVWAFVQNPNLVNTKFANNITAFFIGNLQDIYGNVLTWVEHLKSKGFTEKCPLFPKVRSAFNSDGLPSLILEKQFIKSQCSIREIFKRAFNDNDLPYHKPHTFRHAMTRKMMRSNKSPLFIAAFAQNMGQRDVGVIIASYGTSPDHERAIILKSFELE
jgi:integrase/recombinase XerD